MKINKYFSRLFMFALCGGMLWSCAEDINLSNVVIDEGMYESVNHLSGMLLDRTTNKRENVVELYSNSYDAEVYFKLSQRPMKGVDVSVKLNPDYLEEYNEEHGTSFVLYPRMEEFVTITNGNLLLAPDDLMSPHSAKLSINTTKMIPDPGRPGEEIEDAVGLSKNVTYVIPVLAEILTDGVEIESERVHVVYLVKDLRDTTPYKGEGAMTNVLYVEVNDVNPLNALEFVLEDGSLFFDQVVLFAGNINYDAENERIYLQCNENVQFLLDNNEEFLQPMRKRGMKVILGILGNHDPAGVAQLSEAGAKMFARDLAAACNAYNLDGVAFDDEYSKDPIKGHPLFVDRASAGAASRLFYETKKAMPDKIVSVFFYGMNLDSRWMETVDGVLPGEFIDYGVTDYGSESGRVDGWPDGYGNCCGMSIELNMGDGDSSESMARARRNAGYGYYMFFGLNPAYYYKSHDDALPQVPRCQDASRGLYERRLMDPTHYYQKNELRRVPVQR